MRSGFAVVCLCAALALGACTSTASREEADKNSRVAGNYLELGLTYMQQGRLDIALERLQRALDADPRNAAVHDTIAVLYERLGERGKARRHFRKAVDLEPDFARAHNNYGNFLCSQGELRAAESQFRAAFENPLYQTPWTAYTNAGVCALKGQKAEQAEQYFRKALQANPRTPGALLQMAFINFDAGNLLSTRAYLQRYQEVARHTADSLWLGIRAERELGDLDAVASYALLLRAQFPDSEQVQLLNELESGLRSGR